jgi:hypothetical protein
MPKRFPLLALFLAWSLALDAPAGSIEVARGLCRSLPRSNGNFSANNRAATIRRVVFRRT